LREQTEKLAALTEQARSAGWYLPHEHICWVSERHSLLERDGQGRLHSIAGPAVLYPDGWAIYAVHGVRVPERVVMASDQLTPPEIIGERNAEIRRVMIELFGQERFLRESEAKVVDTDETIGTLWRVSLPNDEPLVMVEVENSTPEPDGSIRRYYLRVPPQIETARAAVAWTFDMPEQDYQVVMET
jgi:hypothetical protein